MVEIFISSYIGNQCSEMVIIRNCIRIMPTLSEKKFDRILYRVTEWPSKGLLILRNSLVQL